MFYDYHKTVEIKSNFVRSYYNRVSARSHPAKDRGRRGLPKKWCWWCVCVMRNTITINLPTANPLLLSWQQLFRLHSADRQRRERREPLPGTLPAEWWNRIEITGEIFEMKFFKLSVVISALSHWRSIKMNQSFVKSKYTNSLALTVLNS